MINLFFIYIVIQKLLYWDIVIILLCLDRLKNFSLQEHKVFPWHRQNRDFTFIWFSIRDYVFLFAFLTPALHYIVGGIFFSKGFRLIIWTWTVFNYLEITNQLLEASVQSIHHKNSKNSHTIVKRAQNRHCFMCLHFWVDWAEVRLQKYRVVIIEYPAFSAK